MAMFMILPLIILTISPATQAATPDRATPASLHILHTARGEGEISPCG